MSMSHLSEIKARLGLLMGGDSGEVAPVGGSWEIVRVSLQDHVCPDSEHLHEHQLIVKMYHL